MSGGRYLKYVNTTKELENVLGSVQSFIGTTGNTTTYKVPVSSTDTKIVTRPIKCLRSGFKPMDFIFTYISWSKMSDIIFRGDILVPRTPSKGKVPPGVSYTARANVIIIVFQLCACC